MNICKCVPALSFWHFGSSRGAASFFSLSSRQALAALSLLPAMKMLRTILPAPLEHFVAYAWVAAIAMAAYIPSRVGVRIIGGLCVYAGILEYIRHFSLGRHPTLRKFAGSA